MTRPYVHLQGFDDIAEVLLMTELENNMKQFFDYGLLGKGAFQDVTVPSSGAYGGEFSALRLVDDPSYEEGQVWESARKDWVWETGVNYPSGEPLDVEVYVDGDLKDLNESGFEHHINYPLGRVIFDEPLDTTSAVEAEYSYRWCQIYKADDSPWFQELQYNSFRVDDDHFTRLSEGDWSIGGQTRIQMPCMVIEATTRSSATPYEQGNNSLIVHQDVAFHVMAENRVDRNRLLDIIRLQSLKTIILFDTNDVVAAEEYPLDYRGMYVGGMMYPDLVDTYPFEKCKFHGAYITNCATVNPKLYIGTIVVTFQVILHNI